MGLLDKLFGDRRPDDYMTDDEKELRDYEENEYNGDSRIDENGYAEFIIAASYESKTGVSADGVVTEGTFRTGDRVEIVHNGTHAEFSEIAAIKFCGKDVSSVSEGSKAELWLKDTEKKQLRRNDIIKKIAKE